MQNIINFYYLLPPSKDVPLKKSQLLHTFVFFQQICYKIVSKLFFYSYPFATSQLKLMIRTMIQFKIFFLSFITSTIHFNGQDPSLDLYGTTSSKEDMFLDSIIIFLCYIMGIEFIHKETICITIVYIAYKNTAIVLGLIFTFFGI